MKKKDLEIQVEPWVKVTFSWHLPGDYQNRHLEHVIEMPRHMLERWKWIIEWRLSWLICRNPRVVHDTRWSFYDKKSGMDMGLNSLLSKISATKAQLTKWKNKLEAYENVKKRELFSNLDEDPLYQKALLKISNQQDKLICLMNEYELELKKKNEGNSN